MSLGNFIILYFVRTQRRFCCILVVLGPVYTIPFSYEDGTEMFCFGLPCTLYRFPIRHQMKTVAYENT